MIGMTCLEIGIKILCDCAERQRGEVKSAVMSQHQRMNRRGLILFSIQYRAPAVDPDVPKHIFRFSCAALHTRRADTQFVRSPSGNHPLPTRQVHHKAFVTGAVELVFLLYRPCLIQTAGIDNRLYIVISTKHDQKVGNHGSFSFFVQNDDVVFVQLL